jgi:hypothetical protein
MNRIFVCMMVLNVIMSGCSSGVNNAISKIPSTPLEFSDGIGFAIVYDTSGSMVDVVKDGNGNVKAKYELANKAFLTAVDQIDAYINAAPNGETRKVLISLVTFDGNGCIAVRLNPEPFDAAKMKSFLNGFSDCGGATPLGDAILVAERQLNYGNMSKRHLLVLTDGQSNVGDNPMDVISNIRKEEANSATTSIYVIAYDTKLSNFDPVKKLGVSVVEAADGIQLSTELNTIVSTKILLEEPE